jgi:hypothetical protein
MGEIVMKKSFLFILMLIIVFSFSATNVFAAEQTKQIDVYLDGDIITFSVNPLLDNGSTLVQFKPVFEKLGLKIDWNEKTKTVKGASKDLNIELSIGSKTVTVNGVKKQLTVAPKIINGVTMVPLRFIGEASGRDVSWDGRTKTVYVAKTDEQVYYATALNIAYMNTEDLEGVLTTYDPVAIDLEQTRANFESNFSNFDLKYELENMEIISLEKETASVKVTLKTTKIAGPAFDDNRTDLITFLNKVKGEWKVASTTDLKIDFMKDELKKEEPVTLSAEDQKLVLAVIEKYRDTRVKGDLEAFKLTLDPSYPNLENVLERYKEMFAAYKFEVTYSNVKIIKGADGEAKVYSMAHVHKISGPEFSDLNEDSIETVKKNKDGEWKITNSEDLTIEYL